MKNNLIILLSLMIGCFAYTQNFEGTLLYDCKTNIHIEDEISFKYKNPNKKNDSINVIINDSTLLNQMTKKGQIIDSVKIVFGNNKLRKTYYKKEKIEYIFDFSTGKKISHTPKYECIDTTDIKLIDYKNKVKITENDSTFIIGNQKSNKISVSKSGYYFIDIYYTDSEYKNLANAFLFDINNNLLFQNLYFLRDKLQHKKITKLKYYTKLDKVDFEYILSSTIESEISEEDFILPKYEFCQWDILEDRKLRRKHKKRKRLKQKKQ